MIGHKKCLELKQTSEKIKQFVHSALQSFLLRDKVTRVLLLWVNNHFTDFETDPTMMEFLERFEAELEAAKMQGETIFRKDFLHLHSLQVN